MVGVDESELERVSKLSHRRNEKDMMKAAEEEFMDNSLPHIQARFCDPDGSLGSNIRLKIAGYFPVKNISMASEETSENDDLLETVGKRIDDNSDVDLVAILADDTITPKGIAQTVGIAWTGTVCERKNRMFNIGSKIVNSNQINFSINEFGGSLDSFVSVSI